MAEGGVKVLIDNCISPRLVEYMRNLQVREISSLSVVFPGVLLDEDWIPKAIARGYVVITHDHNMRLKSPQADILKSVNARVIFLNQTIHDFNAYQQSLWFFRFWPKIKDHAAEMKPGDLAVIDARGVIRPVDFGQSLGNSKKKRRSASFGKGGRGSSKEKELTGTLF